MAADEEDTVVSLQDVLEENRQLEETANAVLGPSDDSSCTYSNVSPPLTCVLCKTVCVCVFVGIR